MKKVKIENGEFVPRFRLTGSMMAWIASVILLAGVLGIAVSCTDTEIVGQPSELSFTPVASVATKAPVNGTTFPTTRPILLAAWQFDDANAYVGRWFSGVSFGHQSSDGKWHATPPKYYPLQGSLRFVGLSKVGLEGTVTYPATYDNATNAAKAKILYVMPDNSTVQDDVLYSHVCNGSNSNNPVAMEFYHAQAQVAFTAASTVVYSEDATNGNYGITIKSITLGSMKYSGTLHVQEGGIGESVPEDYWSDLGSAKTLAVPDVAAAGLNVTVAPTATPHQAVGTGVMMPAQEFPGFTMVYTLHNGKDGDGTQLSKDFTYSWTPSGTMNLVMGNRYVFDITFTLNEILVTPTLTDWVGWTTGISIPPAFSGD